MKDSVIVKKSKEFALMSIKFCAKLKEINEWEFYKQLFKSSTSIGANAHEAQDAQSKADFISKLSISLKESRETDFWLDLILESELKIKKSEVKILRQKNEELTKILVSIIKTAKKNLN